MEIKQNKVLDLEYLLPRILKKALLLVNMQQMLLINFNYVMQEEEICVLTYINQKKILSLYFYHQSSTADMCL